LPKAARYLLRMIHHLRSAPNNAEQWHLQRISPTQCFFCVSTSTYNARDNLTFGEKAVLARNKFCLASYPGYMA